MNAPISKRATVSKEVITNYFYDCPCCTTGKFSYGHLRDDTGWSSVTWTCKDCGAVVKAEFDKDDRDIITVTDTGKIEKDYDCLVLLRFVGSTPEEPFYIVVQDKWNASAQDKPLGETHIYYYDQHTCPWNYLGIPTMYCNDTDYHGLFTHLKTVLGPTDEQLQYILGDDYGDENLMPEKGNYLPWVNDLSTEQWQRLFFPEHNTAGQTTTPLSLT